MNGPIEFVQPAMTRKTTSIVSRQFCVIMHSFCSRRINQARKKCCAPFSLSSADKDGAKVEDANGEFSHEMQIKASGNEYTVDNSNWVSLILFKKNLEIALRYGSLFILTHALLISFKQDYAI